MRIIAARAKTVTEAVLTIRSWEPSGSVSAITTTGTMSETVVVMSRVTSGGDKREIPDWVTDLLVECRNAADAIASAMITGACVVVAESETSSRVAIARRKTLTISSEMLTPKNADAGVGEESEKISSANKKTTPMADASVMPRATVSDVAVEAAIEGLIRITQVMSQAPMATIVPSARTARVREPRRDLMTNIRTMASSICTAKNNASDENCWVVVSDWSPIHNPPSAAPVVRIAKNAMVGVGR